HFAAALEDLLDRRLVAHAALVEALARAARRGTRIVVFVFVVVIFAGAAVAVLPAQVLVVLVFDVADVQESVASDAEIDEGRLDAGLDIDDSALVDVPGE